MIDLAVRVDCRRPKEVVKMLEDMFDMPVNKVYYSLLTFVRDSINWHEAELTERELRRRQENQIDSIRKDIAYPFAAMPTHKELTITNINNTTDLYEEGSKMSHCCYTMRHTFVAGNYVFFHAVHSDKSEATAHIEGWEDGKWRFVYAKGPRNSNNAATEALEKCLSKFVVGLTRVTPHSVTVDVEGTVMSLAEFEAMVSGKSSSDTKDVDFDPLADEDDEFEDPIVGNATIPADDGRTRLIDRELIPLIEERALEI